jgi:hypothetical protein
MNKQDLIKQLKNSSPKPFIKYTKPKREKAKKRQLMINLNEENFSLKHYLPKK